MRAWACLAATILTACTVHTSPATDAPPGAHPDDPDWAVLRGRFDRPDGTLTGSVAASVLAPAPANAADALPSPEECPVLQLGEKHGTCPCTVSGSWDFDGEHDAAAKTTTLRSTYHACDRGAGVVDGHQIVHAEPDRAFVVNAYAITAKGTTNRVDLVSQAVGKDFLFATKVDDGWVTLDRKSGVVRDQAGSWTCTTSDTEYACASADGRPAIVARR